MSLDIASVIASSAATKQSRSCGRGGLLRCARNDDFVDSVPPLALTPAQGFAKRAAITVNAIFWSFPWPTPRRSASSSSS